MFARLFCTFLLLALFIPTISATETGYLDFVGEPTVRIGLSINARSVSIATSDTQLVAALPDEANKFLATASVSVTARAYRTPEIEIYNFEIANLESQAEAESIAKDIREATGEKALASLDFKTNKWRVRIGETKEIIEEAEQFKKGLAEKGFDDVVIVPEKPARRSR
jgi:SPOR domain